MLANFLGVLPILTPPLCALVFIMHAHISMCTHFYMQFWPVFLCMSILVATSTVIMTVICRIVPLLCLYCPSLPPVLSNYLPIFLLSNFVIREHYINGVRQNISFEIGFFLSLPLRPFCFVCVNHLSLFYYWVEFHAWAQFYIFPYTCYHSETNAFIILLYFCPMAVKSSILMADLFYS
jgi:hypothetical protein